MKFLVVLVSCLGVLSGSAGYRFLAILPLNVRSHFMMYEVVLKTLASKGHQVDVISTFPLQKPIPNYTDLFVFPQPHVLMNNLDYSLLSTTVHGPSTVKAFLKFGGNSLCPLLSHPKILDLVKNPPKNPPYDAIILELFGGPCFYVIGYLLNLPIMAMSSAVLYPWSNRDIANPENLAYVSNTLLAYPHNMTFWQRVYNTVHSYLIREYYELLTNNQDDIIRKIFGEGLPSVRELERRASLILVNSHISLVGNRPTMPAYIEVAGLHVQDNDTPLSASLEKWMNESTDGFVYFTFGSMMLIETFPEEILQIFYKSLAKVAPVRVLVKILTPSLLPPGLPNNIRPEGWMPQLKILKHPNIKAFITHGGLMGTQEAIYCGVPLIGIPLFGDQFINIEIYASKKIAVKLNLDSLTVEAMDAALDAVLNDPIYRENMRNISIRFRDRPMSPTDTAVYWIEYVMRHGADVLRSPAMDLTWWQIELLDVYGFLLLVAIVILVAVATALRYLVKLISTGTRRISRPKKVD